MKGIGEDSGYTYSTRDYGRSLRRARRLVGATQEQLADRIGVTKSYVSKLENGEIIPSSRTFKQIGMRLGEAWPGRYGDEVSILIPNTQTSSISDTRAEQLELDLHTEADWVRDLLPLETEVESGPPPVLHWDIPQTISELSYLTHNFFRYYGKFPPTIPRRLLRDFRPPRGTWVLDNFSGSGTTLVEAKCEGVPSVGVDVSPIATLVSKVKTTHVDLSKVNELLSQVSKASLDNVKTFEGVQLPPSKDLSKWFRPQAVDQLASLKRSILVLDPSLEKDFLSCAFFAIVRRVSVAYDGEVRPHVNPTKKSRDVIAAFEKKVADMTMRMTQFKRESSPSIPSVALTGDNRNLSSLTTWEERPIGLTISHPPYLNCFDYFPAYKLEYLWAAGFDEPGLEIEFRDLRHQETRCWPATKESIFGGYFDGLRKAFTEVASLTERGTKCCVVLGDCSIHGEVVPVLDRFSDIMHDLGFNLDRLLMRSTHYGVGKYAYANRADYHGELAQKRDGILVFKRR